MIRHDIFILTIQYQKSTLTSPLGVFNPSQYLMIPDKTPQMIPDNTPQYLTEPGFFHTRGIANTLSIICSMIPVSSWYLDDTELPAASVDQMSVGQMFFDRKT
jgi:hypothetical protein